MVELHLSLIEQRSVHIQFDSRQKCRKASTKITHLQNKKKMFERKILITATIQINQTQTGSNRLISRSYIIDYVFDL